MRIFSKSFLHHGVVCQVSAEVGDTCTVSGYVNGVSIYLENSIRKNELELKLGNAEKNVKEHAEKTAPLGPQIDATERMFLRLGYLRVRQAMTTEEEIQ